jgi:hypothetical protein
VGRRVSSDVPSCRARRGTARIAAVQLRKKTRRGEGGPGLEWVDLVEKENGPRGSKGLLSSSLLFFLILLLIFLAAFF